MSEGKKDTAYIVTHTHWDREWRYPLWENRMYLVKLMGELLNILDNDSEYKSFILDGQSVIIEDYLQVRPENEEKIRKYINEGRISVGPWYTLPDLYPLDGECLIRNLLKGIRYSKSLGGCLNVAYESFGWGQTAQFPQIYKGFGFDIVIVAKNVSKDRAPHSEFLWESPDGTKILTTRLGQHGRANFFMNSYSKIMNGMDYLSEQYRLNWENAGMLYHNANQENFYQDYLQMGNTEKIHKELIREAIEIAWTATEETTVKSHRILMNGSDSTTSQPALTEIIKEANQLFDNIEFVHANLEEYTDKLKDLIDTESLKIVKGELRDGPAYACSANALMTRPRLKILNKKVQNELLHKAEPLSVINVMLGLKYDKNFLDTAIKYMLLSHPHDSINGVTQDKTADDVMYMLNQSLEISEVITNTACSEIIRRIDTASFDNKDILMIVFNPSANQRSEVVKVYLDTPNEFNIWDFDIFDCNENKMRTQFVSRKEEVVPVNDLHARPWPFYLDRHCFYMETGEIPAGGYKTFKLVPTKNFNRKAVFWAEMRTSRGLEISKASNVMENEYLKVNVENNGTISIYEKSSGTQYKNLNYFEDTGDCGDYWMYYPPHHNMTFTSQGCKARIWTEDNGELSATIAAEIKLTVPAYALRPENEIRGESRRSDEEREMTLTSYYTLKSGAKCINIRLKVENNVEDHRLRVLFNTGIKAEYADAAGHFTVDRRSVNPLVNEAGEYWPEMQTLPQQNFVGLSDGKIGFAVINNCLTEYEALNNEEGTLALTLLRGVRNIICTEFRSAGVFPNQKGGQSLGILEYEYDLYSHEGDWNNARVYEEAERLNVPLKLIQTCKHDGGNLPLEQSFYSIEPTGLVVSAFKRAEDRESFILRCFNPTDKTLEGDIKVFAEIKEAFLTDLNENRTENIPVRNAHAIQIKVLSKQILTVEIVFEEVKI